MPKITLNPTLRAQILAGANEIDLGEETPAPATPGTKPATPAAEGTPAAPAAPAAAESQKPAVSGEVFEFVNQQLAQANEQLGKLRLEIATMQAEAAKSTALLPDLLEIAKASVGRMQVALGSPDSSAALNAADAVGEHKRLLPIFNEKLKVGGVAAPAAGTEPPSTAPQATPEFLQRLALANNVSA